MMAYRQNTALAQYQSNGVAGAIGDATPHQLVQMLFAGALDRLAQAKGGVMRGDRAQKLQGIAKAVAIIEHLRLNLDLEGGGQIARTCRTSMTTWCAACSRPTSRTMRAFSTRSRASCAMSNRPGTRFPTISGPRACRPEPTET